MIFKIVIGIGVLLIIYKLVKKYTLVHIFKDTLLRIDNNPELKKETEDMISNIKTYDENFIAEIRKVFPHASIDVAGKRTMECVCELSKGDSHITVLNFASGTTPGGGVKRGAQSQEESICRITNLFPALATLNCWSKFYASNRLDISELYTDRIIYTPNVTVLKTDGKRPSLLENPFKVDIITCPAPNLRNKLYFNKERLRGILNKRITNILEAAIDNRTEILVLGAFGCGVFMNPPEIVAEAFKEILEKEDYIHNFKKVVFAIPEGSKNYKIFSKIFI